MDNNSVILLDNLDSFTYNLADYIKQGGVEVKVIRNDEPLIKILNAIEASKGLIISPGPGSPQNTNNLEAIINSTFKTKPILGICLGHQALGLHFGAKLVKATKPMHGKLSEIYCEEDAIFINIPKKFKVVRYHSLILNKLPAELACIARTGEEIMAIKHRLWPIYGFQFHPEAVLTEFGKELLNNWLNAYIKDQIE
jgi:anthranilate synthase/aminodeoxychorismate synthase-like glutamine amidotransferase